MNLRKGEGALWLTIGLVVGFVTLGNAATPLPPAPPGGWYADGSNTTGFFGVRAGPTVPPPTGTCTSIPNCLSTATIIYAGNTYGANGGTVIGANLTDWAQMWGRILGAAPGHPAPAPIGYPGVDGSSPTVFLGNNQFFCSEFTAPISLIGKTGMYTTPTYESAGNFTIAITPSCGDFTPVNSACKAEHVTPYSGSLRYSWNGNGCSLTPGTPLFVNVKWSGTPIDYNGKFCTAAGCRIGIKHNAY